jgi:hypothetical protein
LRFIPKLSTACKKDVEDAVVDVEDEEESVISASTALEPLGFEERRALRLMFVEYNISLFANRLLSPNNLEQDSDAEDGRINEQDVADY